MSITQYRYEQPNLILGSEQTQMYYEQKMSHCLNKTGLLGLHKHWTKVLNLTFNDNQKQKTTTNWMQYH